MDEARTGQTLHQILHLMIFVSQGHQHAIGLEIFLKAIASLKPQQRRHFHLACYKDALEETLDSMPPLDTSGAKMTFLKDAEHSQSMSSLNWCLQQIRPFKDILLTLPTTKNQFSNQCLGHTEFFRHLYQDENLAMVFNSPKETILLITDHIPLAKVAHVIDSSLIISKVQTCLTSHFHFNEVLLAGINPHAGEGGLIGKEERHIEQAISHLRQEFPRIRFKGPLPADTLHFHLKENVGQLTVYMYHDQGLPRFKGIYPLTGIHMTLGLPFLRLGPDHGTAFELYGKNQADDKGMRYLLSECLRHEQ